MRGLFGGSGSSVSSQSKSRKERLEAAKEQNERSRRKTFAFMKYSPDRRSTTSLAKTRAHAKELAMAVSNDEEDDPELFMEGIGVPETAMSEQHLQFAPKSTSLLDSADDFDPFNHHGGGGGGFHAAPLVTKPPRGNAMMLDQHLSSQEPTASTTMSSLQDSFETGSVGSAYDMDAFLGGGFSSPGGSQHKKKRNTVQASSTTTRKKKSGPSLDQFVERNQGPLSYPSEQHSVMSGPRTGGGWASTERSVISMPTFPSNSSMQASFTRQSSVISSSSGASSGAAARRRMRNQMRHSSNSSVCSDTSSVASGTPPESPSSGVRRNVISAGETTPGSAGHPRRGSNSNHNRLLQYQVPPLPGSAGSNGRPKINSGSSFYSQGSSGNNSQSSEAINLFSAEDGGFTFDAFGLDASEVEREVNEAMQELAGQVPGFSVFFEDHHHHQHAPFPSQQQHHGPAASPSRSIHSTVSGPSPRGGVQKQKQHHLPQLQLDEFAPQNWDSPQGSRTATPVPLDSEDDGFVDGFRVTRSSVENQSAEHQDQSGFSSPTGSAALRRRLGRSSANLSPAKSPIKPTNVHTPPRWENSAGRNTTRQSSNNKYQQSQQPPIGGSSPFSDPYNVSPDMSDLFGTPVNPWKDDPWNSGQSDDDPFQSDDNGNNSDVGTNSDFGTKSDIAGGAERFNSANLWTASSSEKKKNARVLSDSKSDVGGGFNTITKSVSFHADVRLPPQQPQHQYEQPSAHPQDDADNWTDEDEEHEQMSDIMAQEFAATFVNRLQQPAARQAPATNSLSPARRLDFESNVSSGGRAAAAAPSSDHGAPGSDFTQSDYGAPSEVGSGFGTADSYFFGQSDQGGAVDEFGSESDVGPSGRWDYNDDVPDHRGPQSADYGPTKSPRGGPATDSGPAKSPRGGVPSPMDYGPSKSPRGLQGADYVPTKSPRGLQQQDTYGSSPSHALHPGDYGPSKSPRGGRQLGDYGPEKSPVGGVPSGDYGPAKSPRGAPASPSKYTTQQQYHGQSAYGETSDYGNQQSQYGPTSESSFSYQGNDSDYPQSEGGATSDYDANVRRNGPQESKSPRHATSPPSWLPNTGVAKYGSQKMPSLSDHGQQYGSSYRENSNVGANSDYGQSSDGGAGSRYIGSEDGVNSDFHDRHSDVSIGMLPGEVSSKERPASKSPRVYDHRTIRSEEKKDDEAQEETKTSFSLKDKWRKWESKQAKASVSSTSPALQEPSRVSASSVSQLQKTLGGELLTPDVVESRRQAARKMRAEDLRNSTIPNSMLAPDALRRPTNAVPVKEERTNECYEQRNSFASFRDRLKTSPQSREGATAKSESGAAFRTSSIANKVLSRISPRNGEVINNVSAPYHDTQSDTGSTPSFLANVKLRKTKGAYDPSREDLHQNYSTDIETENDYASPGTQNERHTSYRERRPWEQQSTQEDEYSYSPNGPEDEPEAEPEKKLTYRERRELELRQDQQEKAKKETPKTAPKRDVASLIRRRIAANKAKEEGVKSSEQGDEGSGVSQYRGMLKPSKMPNKVNEDIGPASSYDTESNSLYSVGSVSPRRVPLPGTHETRNVHGNAHPATNLREHLNYHVQSGGQALHKMISPTSANSEMNYSSSTYTADGGDNGASHAGPELRSPRAAPDNRDREKPTPRALQQLQKKDSFSGSPRIETPETTATSQTSEDHKGGDLDVSPRNPAEVKAMLVNFLGGKGSKEAEVSSEDAAHTLMRSREPRPSKTEALFHETVQTYEKSESMPKSSNNDGRPALKDDPKYERYFRMLKVGMPMEVVKHAMTKDGNDPSVMDGDHNSPVGLALKDDPKYEKYFKMLKFGIKMDQVKHAMERDGLMPGVMDQDHNLPAQSCELRSQDEPKEKPTHRRARLHWKTLQKVRSNSLWAKLEQDQMLNEIDIDENEFKELFQADLAPVVSPKGLGVNRKRGAAVRVIDAKRANNGGIILARLKMTHDDMADAVDRIDGSELSPEQIENIIEFLPTKDERKLLEAYMLEGGQDAAEKFDGLCECEKFMVSMMTVKHAKRKVRALLFKLQFLSCLQSITAETTSVETACDELSNSTRLRHLLGIVLEFGNRLNTAGVNSQRKAGAFSLESLLKLNQAKAFDKKTTFLHYVVLIVRRNNELLLRFQDDLPTVLKADKVYWDQCLADLEEVENQLENVRRISLYQARIQQEYRLKRRNPREDDNDSLGDVSLSLEEEVESLRATNIGLFTLGAIKKVSAIRDKVELTKEKFNRLLEYFGEEEKKLQPHELFNYIAVFCRDFGKAREEVFDNMQKKMREDRKKALQITPNGKNGKPPAAPERGSQKPLRASSFQPNMSKVIKDFQRSDSDPAGRQESSKSPRSSPRSTTQKQIERNHFDSSKLTDAQNQPPDIRKIPKHSPPPPSRPKVEAALPPGRQEAGRLEDRAFGRADNRPPTSRVLPSQPLAMPSQPIPTTSPSAYSTSAKNAMRQKVRMRRQRQMQVTTGRATPVASNTSSAPVPGTPPAIPYANVQTSPHVNHISHLAPSDSYDDAPTTRGSPRTMMRHRKRHVEALKRSSPTSQMQPNSNGLDWPVQPNVAAM